MSLPLRPRSLEVVCVLPHVYAQDGAAATALDGSSARQRPHQRVVLVGGRRDSKPPTRSSSTAVACKHACTRDKVKLQECSAKGVGLRQVVAMGQHQRRQGESAERRSASMCAVWAASALLLQLVAIQLAVIHSASSV
jgi:hypothetical protein